MKIKSIKKYYLFIFFIILYDHHFMYASFPSLFKIKATWKLHQATNLLRKIPIKWHIILRRLNQDTNVTFLESQIDACFLKICKKKDLRPLFALHKHTSLLYSDNAFITDYARLIFIIYKEIIEDIAATILTKRSGIAVITSKLLTIAIETYNKIQSLPLEEILDVIDLLMFQVPQLMEDYDFSSYSTWQEWSKKHWLVISLSVITITIKILLIFKKNTIHEITDHQIGPIIPTVNATTSIKKEAVSGDNVQNAI